ncbi:MAG: cytotoxic translational repressor of toxin-antitoxin stability system [Desulfovibrionaceae bacterium]|nr:cytotoxic translational repressor of toxin-antitoxin stability system [Desulfovibrionaceae bacterium]MBF0514957.1 cytotoxic translational repressor of toxin-antitoxin stability system [Desulfovibrionaceae bacterium]
MAWTVAISRRAAKRANVLPLAAQDALRQLLLDIRETGPVQKAWPNYGKIAGRPGCHHCHIRKGRPTYVVVWRVAPEQTVEVLYVGTHERADYGRIC